MNLKRFLKSDAGFTLTELLVVIVIIGILAALTIPKFVNVTVRAKTTEAKLMLKTLYNLEKAYYLENDMYTDSFEAIGFEQSRLKTDGGTARYRIEITNAGPAEFIATATSVIDFDKDGVFNVWSINQEGVLKQEIAD